MLTEAGRGFFERSRSALEDLGNVIAATRDQGRIPTGRVRITAPTDIGALLLAWGLIVLYLRVRFHEYKYGLAAVVALIHDVLVTLGAIAISAYVVNMVPALAEALQIQSFQISLTVVAAFLTIIGYSLNDTIVIFDRVRENLPRMKAPLREVLNTSINQTLSRTVLTSGTTLIAVGILFFLNFGTGNVLESFSFAMMIGVLTGTYSTIFIANPVLLWLETRNGDPKLKKPKKAQKAEPAKV